MFYSQLRNNTDAFYGYSGFCSNLNVKMESLLRSFYKGDFENAAPFAELLAEMRESPCARTISDMVNEIISSAVPK